jgi:hypothetical protein
MLALFQDHWDRDLYGLAAHEAAKMLAENWETMAAEHRDFEEVMSSDVHLVVMNLRNWLIALRKHLASSGRIAVHEFRKRKR